MQYLEGFDLPSSDAEDGFLMYSPMLDMSCYTQSNIHPFRFFSSRGLFRFALSPITIIYGGNGSGKSTLLNLVAEKLRLSRRAPFNRTPFFNEYLSLCNAKISPRNGIPRESCIITSDDVFDYLLDLRNINQGVARKREELFREYEAESALSKAGIPVQFHGFEDIERLRRRNEVNHSTRSAYAARRIPKEFCGKSNGESAYLYFTENIRENALYLLDEPENSLSAKLQAELAVFLEEAVRFYNCQFLISTHSPFLLSMRGARIYDLDSVPVAEKRWTELENVKIYRELFLKREGDFTD